MCLNFTVKLPSVTTTFRPACAQIGFVGCNEAWAWRIRFHVWAFAGVGILPDRLVVETKFTRNILQCCPFCVPFTNGGPTLKALPLRLFALHVRIFATPIDAFAR